MGTARKLEKLTAALKRARKEAERASRAQKNVGRVGPVDNNKSYNGPGKLA